MMIEIQKTNLKNCIAFPNYVVTEFLLDDTYTIEDMRPRTVISEIH